MSFRTQIQLSIAAASVLDLFWILWWINFNTLLSQAARFRFVCGTPRVNHAVHGYYLFLASALVLYLGLRLVSRGRASARIDTLHIIHRLPLSALLAFTLALILCRILMPC